MKINEQITNLKKLNLPVSDFVVVGSAALAIHGIRDAKDVDVIVTEHLWEELKKEHEVTINSWNVETLCLPYDVEVLNPKQSIFGNSKVVSLEAIFAKADIFEGIKFINLGHLQRIKLKLGRPIDLRDFILINAHLNQEK